MKKTSRKMSILLLCMSALFFAVLLMNIDISLIPGIVTGTDRSLVVYAFIVMIVSDLLNAFKVSMILDLPFSIRFVVKMFFVNQRTFFLSQFLPSDLLGITYRARFISEFASEDTSVYTIIYDKYTQVVSTILVGLVSTTILLFLWDHTIVFGVFLFMFVVFLLIPLILQATATRNLIRKLFPGSFADVLIARSSQIMNIYAMLKQFGWVLLLSSVIQLIFSLSVYIICMSIGIKMDYLAIVIALCATSIVIMLPLSYNGFGLREITLVFLLYVIQVQPEKAFVMSMYIMILSFIKIFVGAIFNFAVFFKKKSRTTGRMR